MEIYIGSKEEVLPFFASQAICCRMGYGFQGFLSRIGPPYQFQYSHFIKSATQKTFCFNFGHIDAWQNYAVHNNCCGMICTHNGRCYKQGHKQGNLFSRKIRDLQRICSKSYPPPPRHFCLVWPHTNYTVYPCSCALIKNPCLQLSPTSILSWSGSAIYLL